jgi:hypothetical protein
VESLLDVMLSVVEPAVRAVFADSEVEALRLSVADEGGFSMRVVAVGEAYEDWVIQPDAQSMSPDDWRERLRSNLVDFVAESRFGWGQNREDGPPT